MAGNESRGLENRTNTTEAASPHEGLEAWKTLAQVPVRKPRDKQAPTSDLKRYGTWLEDGAVEALPGAWHAVERDFGTWEGLKSTGETLATSALLGAALKVALPEGGMAGKLASLAIGGYFMYKASTPVVESYQHARDAKTMSQLHAAGGQLGEAVGDFGVSTVIAAGGYHVGAGLTNRMLETEAFDSFAAKKARVWHPVEKYLAGHTPDWLADAMISPEAIQRARTIDLNTRAWDVKGNTASLLDSMRHKPVGESMGPMDPTAKVRLSVYARSVDETGIKLDRRLKRIATGKAGFVTDEEMAAKYGASTKSMSEIQKWAESKGLKVELQDDRTGRMSLSGTVADVEKAIGTKLEQWKSPDGQIHRTRTGALSVDASVAPHIDAILGADNRPQMRSMRTPFVPLEAAKAEPAAGEGPEHHAVGPTPRDGGPQPIYADDLARARGLTVDENTGKGKVVGIGELGGDIDLDQDAEFYKKQGKPVPDRIKKGVNGTVPQSDGPNGADGEVALDTNNVGLAAPGAKQVIAFGENSDAGFPDTQNELAFPTDGAPAADTISWSWGQNQEAWTKQAQSALTNALKRSAAKGITTFVASGDNGAADGAKTGLDVDFPSASPFVTSVGGTQVVLDNGKVVREVAWNDGKRGGQSGGGISNQTPRPDFQNGLRMPVNANGNGFDGRGVPDVAENASPKSGYIVQVDGQEGAIGGTSGAAPMWAAYTAALTSKLGRNLGNLNYFLYKNGTAGIFNDITSGDNFGYKSGPGWDAVTGWGTPIISNFLESLKKDAGSGVRRSHFFLAPINQQQQSTRKVG